MLILASNFVDYHANFNISSLWVGTQENMFHQASKVFAFDVSPLFGRVIHLVVVLDFVSVSHFRQSQES